MYNLTQLIGRLTDNPEVKVLENNKKVCNIRLAVQRTYKNAEGVYEADFIDVTLWEALAERMSEYCHKGDLIAVRGQIRSNTYEKEDGTKAYSLNVIGDKLLFLSTKNVERPDNEVER